MQGVEEKIFKICFEKKRLIFKIYRFFIFVQHISN